MSAAAGEGRNESVRGSRTDVAGQYAGFVVLEEQSDPEQDIYAEPRLIRAIGNVPEEMIAALAA